MKERLGRRQRGRTARKCSSARPCARPLNGPPRLPATLHAPMHAWHHKGCFPRKIQPCARCARTRQPASGSAPPAHRAATVEGLGRESHGDFGIDRRSSECGAATSPGGPVHAGQTPPISAVKLARLAPLLWRVCVRRYVYVSQRPANLGRQVQADLAHCAVPAGMPAPHCCTLSQKQYARKTYPRGRAPQSHSLTRCQGLIEEVFR